MLRRATIRLVASAIVLENFREYKTFKNTTAKQQYTYEF